MYLIYYRSKLQYNQKADLLNFVKLELKFSKISYLEYFGFIKYIYIYIGFKQL